MWLHPFRRGVMKLIESHLGPEIARRFRLIFESQLYTGDLKEIWGQKKHDQHVLEVHYENADGTLVYITDVASWWSKAYTEYHLLRYITDKVKAGKIGSDWVAVSEELKSGKFETKE
jgi:hypothetical protein